MTATDVDPPSHLPSCLVTSTPGAGSRPLCRSLGLTGDLRTPDSLFNPTSVESRRRAWRIVGSGDDVAARYISAARRRSTGASGIASVNLFWMHLRWLISVSREALAQRDGACTLSDGEAVEAWFPGATYVHLHCADTAAQALRWYAGLRAERRQSPVDRGREPDFQEVRWLESLVERNERAWQAYFRVHRILPLMIAYEDMVRRPTVVVADVLGALGLAAPPDDDVDRTWPSRLDGFSDRWSRRYRAVRGDLRAEIGAAGGGSDDDG
jgi:LPS sulfotransferase NodH